MKLIGKVDTYNGRYGIILTKEKEIVDFEYKDISFGQKISVGDLVEFRIERKPGNINLARNINRISPFDV